jgi:hypothetical protein
VGGRGNSEREERRRGFNGGVDEARRGVTITTTSVRSRWARDETLLTVEWIGGESDVEDWAGRELELEESLAL